MAVGANANSDSGRDRPIFIRVFGMGKIHWYVIEEKTPGDLDDEKSLVGCESDHDRIRRLPSLCSDFDIRKMTPAYSNDIAVMNSTVFVIGGDPSSQKKMNKEADRVDSDKHIAYQHMDLDLGEGKWQNGGNLVISQGGGAAVGSDGYIYTVGDNIYRFCPGGRFHEELSSPPTMIEDKVNRRRLLGLTRKTLFIYTIQGGLDGANRMLSFDLRSRKWDILDDHSHGDWSAGVVLYDDEYLFSFCKQNPTRYEEAEVPGIYVFDIKNRKWLPEPVEGLPTDGTVLPLIYTPDLDSDVYVDDTFSAFLLQIGNQDEHKLALVWDSYGTHPESHAPYTECVWSKFVLNRSTSTADQDPQFYANSISSGFCPLDEYTFNIINSAAGMFHIGLHATDSIYEATIDGFSAADFHNCCDFKGPCAIIGYTNMSFKLGALNPEGYRSTDDYYDSFDPFLFYWTDNETTDEPIILPKVGGSGAALFDYARGGPQFGADGLLIGPPLAPVMGGFAGPDTNSGIGDLRQAKSRLGLSYAKRKDGKESLFGDENRATLEEVEVYCSPHIASLY